MKKQILEELGLHDVCAVRLYHNSELICNDMDVVKESKFEKVEVEAYITLEFAVAGKGNSYAIKLDVNPNESLEIIRSKVPFFKMFS